MGSSWRDLPPKLGEWNTVFKRFRAWVKADVFKRMCNAMGGQPDMGYAIVDVSIAKVRRQGQSAKGRLHFRPWVAQEAG
jgi:transposase